VPLIQSRIYPAIELLRQKLPFCFTVFGSSTISTVDARDIESTDSILGSIPSKYVDNYHCSYLLNIFSTSYLRQPPRRVLFSPVPQDIPTLTHLDDVFCMVTDTYNTHSTVFSNSNILNPSFHVPPTIDRVSLPEPKFTPPKVLYTDYQPSTTGGCLRGRDKDYIHQWTEKERQKVKKVLDKDSPLTFTQFKKKVWVFSSHIFKYYF
jgi:hypothetical protein